MVACISAVITMRVLPHLGCNIAFGWCQVRERQAAMARAQRLFMYPSSAQDMPGTAAQTIVDNLCERVQKNYDLQ